VRRILVLGTVKLPAGTNSQAADISIRIPI
jgi:hypothetical protein